jgi:hypothetical protein
MKYDGEQFELTRREAWGASMRRRFISDTLYIGGIIVDTERRIQSCEQDLMVPSDDLASSDRKGSEKLKRVSERQLVVLSQAVHMMIDHELPDLLGEQSQTQPRPQSQLNDETPRFSE